MNLITHLPLILLFLPLGYLHCQPLSLIVICMWLKLHLSCPQPVMYSPITFCVLRSICHLHLQSLKLCIHVA